MICKFQLPWTNGYTDSFSLSLFFSFFFFARNDETVHVSRTRLDNRCYAPIFTRRIFLRVSIETCNILLILPSPDFKIFPNSFKGLAPCYCGGETSSSLFFPLFFFFFLRHALTGIPLYNARSLHNCQHAMLLLPGRNSVQHSAGKMFIPSNYFLYFIPISNHRFLFFLYKIDGPLIRHANFIRENIDIILRGYTSRDI